MEVPVYVIHFASETNFLRFLLLGSLRSFFFLESCAEDIDVSKLERLSPSSFSFIVSFSCWGLVHVPPLYKRKKTLLNKIIGIWKFIKQYMQTLTLIYLDVTLVNWKSLRFKVSSLFTYRNYNICICRRMYNKRGLNLRTIVMNRHARFWHILFTIIYYNVICRKL